MRTKVVASMTAALAPLAVVGITAFSSQGSRTESADATVVVQTASADGGGLPAGAQPAKPSIPPDQQPERLGLKQSHYPRNAHGQTYGSMRKSDEHGETPDLIEALATNGKVGYVRLGDFEAPSSESGQPRRLPVYQSDGTTRIGEYISGTHTFQR